MARDSNCTEPSGSGESDPKNVDQLWTHHLDPTNGTQHTAAWFIGFFLKHQTPWLKAASEFFLFALVFFSAPLNKSTRTLCGGKLYYTIIHMFMWLFFCFISVGWADLHSTSAPKRIHALCVCFTQLLWLVDWFFFSHPAHPSNFGPRPFKASSRKSQGRIFLYLSWTSWP